MEDEQKYAIATIQIPLKISPNGKYDTMLKNIHITFAPATAATIPKSNENEINGEFQNILKNMFSKVTEKDQDQERLEQEKLKQEREQEKLKQEQEQERLEQEQEKEKERQRKESEYPILKSEILPKSGRRNMNTTFKVNPGKSRQYTAKNTGSLSISSDMDADPAEQPMPPGSA